MSSKKHTRHKLILDEGLPPKDRFPTLNSLHSVKHINHDLKKGGTNDPAIYRLAEKEGYMVVVLNIKDFKPFIKKNKPTVLSISTELTNQQIDLKLCKLLKSLKPSEQKGCLISVSNEGVSIKKIKKEN